METTKFLKKIWATSFCIDQFTSSKDTVFCSNGGKKFTKKKIIVEFLKRQHSLLFCKLRCKRKQRQTHLDFFSPQTAEGTVFVKRPIGHSCGLEVWRRTESYVELFTHRSSAATRSLRYVPEFSFCSVQIESRGGPAERVQSNSQQPLGVAFAGRSLRFRRKAHDADFATFL